MDSTPRHEGVFHAARTHTDLKNVQSSKANPESVNSSMTHSTEKIVSHAHHRSQSEQLIETQIIAKKEELNQSQPAISTIVEADLNQIVD